MKNNYKTILKKKLAKGLYKLLTKVDPYFEQKKHYPLQTINNTQDTTNWPSYKTRPMKEGETLLTKAVSFPNSHEHCRSIFESLPESKSYKKMLEIGGSNTLNSQDFFPELDYFNIDIEDNPNLPTIVADITQTTNLEPESVDLIVSHQTFEHIDRPWLASQEITRLLKPGGLCYISTVWSWRYHPVPIDYWRFSPDCLSFLFKELDKIDANFNMYPRRNDMRGFWPNKLDAVPVDELGGWRENWFVYFIGMKPER
ncbi:class I SAM-dependent methyltransferase [Crocosphaera sp. XPORK-15E]|uniref:class I SAM-dependent methyltransferase n=1 Tax=Crocosphaera sp. XPORK-15E TaxID=3110247 RepID=UPI002B21A914|nr:class I SAM-dependent methyltransferase [Crocosphaera sp. XPORK-15E]MEA5534775.1 class I SAM-dependent methyltransferase [Crocosphaera sp. XPORK-15E]